MGKKSNTSACDECGCEIVTGTKCLDCNLPDGNAGIVPTSLVREKPQARESLANIKAHLERPWWKLW